MGIPLFQTALALAFVSWSWTGFVDSMRAATPTPFSIPVLLGDEKCSQGEILEAQIAWTEREKQIGLSGRASPLRTDEAMLFVFDSAGPKNFWMKDTKIPLSIFFFDSRGNLLSSREMKVEADPAHPSVLYEDSGPVAVALEASPGRALNRTRDRNRLCIFP